MIKQGDFIISCGNPLDWSTITPEELFMMDELANGEKMTMTEFISGIKDGFYTPDDGVAIYADRVGQSNLTINFEDVINGDLDYSFTHVVWYQK